MRDKIFSGIVKFTSQDYPNHMACTLFTLGCNLRCRYCHNPEFVEIKNNENLLMDNEEIENFLKSRVGILEGVVICGGEPTIHKGLIEWIKFIKNLGFKVKLDTNGTNPKMLKEILDERLIDFIAIDFKASLKNYKNVTQRNVGFYDRTISSIELVLNSYLGKEKNYDIRTTIHSLLLDREDILEMSKILKSFGVKKYALQLFKPSKILDKNLSKNCDFNFIEDLKEVLIDKFDEFVVRGE